MSKKKSETPKVDEPESGREDKHRILTRLRPNMADGPWPVTNIKGQTFGNIRASGNFSAPTGTAVEVIAVPGGAIPLESIPAIPMPGSVRTHTAANGDWSLDGVPRALCTCSGSLLQNQVIAWGQNHNGTYSIASAHFTGKCTKCRGHVHTGHDKSQDEADRSR